MFGPDDTHVSFTLWRPNGRSRFNGRELQLEVSIRAYVADVAKPSGRRTAGRRYERSTEGVGESS